MNKSTLWNKRTIPRLITIVLSLVSLFLLVGLAAVLQTAYENTYYVSFGHPALAGLFMIGPGWTILHNTTVIAVLLARKPIRSGIDMALDFVGTGTNAASAALLIIEASFAGEILSSCGPRDFGTDEWCREARTILGLEATALSLVLIVGYVVPRPSRSADDATC